MKREIIQTENAPQAIGTYSQAVKVGNTVYLSGQIPLVPETMELVDGDMNMQIHRVFDNLQAVCISSQISTVFEATVHGIHMKALISQYGPQNQKFHDFPGLLPQNGILFARAWIRND